MNGMPQQPNQPQGPFTDDSNWGQLPQPQQPQQPNNNWAQLLGQLAHAYAKKQQAMAPPQPTPVQLPSAPPDIPLPPAQGNAWKTADLNQRAPGHPMYDVRTQMDQQMAELKKTTDEYFAKRGGFGQEPPKPTVVDPNAPQQSAQPAPAQPQAAAPAQAQPSGGQPQQQSSYRSPQRYSSDPATEVPTSPPKPPKKDEKKNKGDSKAKDKGTTNPSNRQMMIDPMMQAKMKSPKEQGRVTAGDITGIYIPSPEQQMVDFGRQVGDLSPVMKSVGNRALGMIDARNGPIGQMVNSIDDAYQLASGNPEGTQGMKMFRGAANRAKGVMSGNPDAIQETGLDIAQGTTGVALGASGRGTAAFGRRFGSSTPGHRGGLTAPKPSSAGARKPSSGGIKNSPPKPPAVKPADGYYDPKVGEILGGKRAPDLKNPKASPPPNQRPNNAPYDSKAKMYEKGKKPLSPGDPGYEYSDYWKKDQALNKRGKFSAQDSGVQVSKSKPAPSSATGRSSRPTVVESVQADKKRFPGGFDGGSPSQKRVEAKKSADARSKADKNRDTSTFSQTGQAARPKSPTPPSTQSRNPKPRTGDKTPKDAKKKTVTSLRNQRMSDKGKK